jgi:hypothetical protein
VFFETNLKGNLLSDQLKHSIQLVGEKVVIFVKVQVLGRGQYIRQRFKDFD